MKFRPLFIISVLSVITSSPAIPAPARACPFPAKILPAATCSSSSFARGLQFGSRKVILAQATCPLADCDCNFRECMTDVDTEHEYAGHETVQSCKQLYDLCEASNFRVQKNHTR